MRRIRHAGLWVATTEKFEALCRTAALRESLAEVGILVVDEIHMLGDATRGPVLEALLTRIRGGAAETRILGLSDRRPPQLRSQRLSACFDTLPNAETFGLHRSCGAAGGPVSVQAR